MRLRIFRPGLGLVVLLAGLAGCASGPTSKAPDEPDLNALWADLAGEDAPRAYRALVRLAEHPARSVPFLRQHLRPVVAISDEQVARLIADLGADDFDARE